MTDLYEKIFAEKKIAYAVFSADYALEQHSHFFTELMIIPLIKKQTILWDIFPELMGCKDQVRDVLQGRQRRFHLEKVGKFSDEINIRYYSLVLFASQTSGLNKLVCLLNDITFETSLEQQIHQQTHKIKLLESTSTRICPPYNRGLIGDSPKVEFVRNFINKTAEFKYTMILLEGETGSGKNLVARLIHNQSMVAKSPFVEVNCAAIPATLIESEIFGYEKGAFSDAANSKNGLLEEANGGTFFLDEISELPIALQSKFLSFLETKTFRRLGSTHERCVHVRIIAATNRNLVQSVERGEFRQDLFFRLNVLSIKLPSLREIGADIIPLVDHFIQFYAFDFKKKACRLSEAARQKLLCHHWPGNVRELRNVIERAVIFADGEEIGAELIVLAGERKTGENGTDSFSALNTTLSLLEIETELIRQALTKAKGNQTHTARALGLTLDALRYRIKKYDIHI